MPIGVRIEESWSWYKAVSMVGGTLRQKLIHRESFRASVLQLTLATTRCQNHCTGILCLDNAFVLIEGHPRLTQASHGTFSQRDPDLEKFYCATSGLAEPFDDSDVPLGRAFEQPAS